MKIFHNYEDEKTSKIQLKIIHKEAFFDMYKKMTIVLILAAAFVLMFSSAASAEFVKGIEKNMELYPNWIVNGETQPIFTYDDAILEIVYVEVPCDTDRDGLRDRVSVWIMRPQTKEGFLCPAMLEHSPYHHSTVGWSAVSGPAFDGPYEYMREPFRYKDNWPIHKDLADPAYADTTHRTYNDIAYKGMEAHEWPWIDEAFETGSWYTGKNYGNVPAATVSATDPITGETIYEPAPAYSSFIGATSFYRYYLPRGYALVYGQLLGARDGDGVTNTLHVEEVLSAMAVIKWLNGEAKGYTSRRGNVETKADWANGHVSMTGTSYPADISFATVVTGVQGLKAVMPQCNGLNWYDYYRYAGTVNSPGGYAGEDLNLHASLNFTRWRADGISNGEIPPANGQWFGKAIQDAFFETQKHMIDKQDILTGDYNTEWELRNFGRHAERINEDVGLLMTTGFMDWNSQPKLSMANWTVLLDKCRGTFKEFASISSHTSQASAVIYDKSIIEWWHVWMDHFLLGLDNGVVETLPDLTVVNTKSGAVEGYWVKGNPNAKPGDADYEPLFLERGGIVPGARNQKIYLVPALSDGKAGRLSYHAPPDAVDHFADMNVLDMLQAMYPGAPTLTDSQKNVNRSNSGNYRVTTGGGVASQAQFCEGRAVGVNRTYDFGITGTTPTDIQAINQQIFASVDKPIEGRLMYLSDPLEKDLRLSGTGVVHLMAAPSKGVGSLSAALVEIGRVRNMESSRADAWSSSVGTGNNLLQLAYALPLGGGLGTMNVGTYRNPSQVGTFMNYKYVTVGYADVQNPNYSGKVWFEVPEQNYIPDFYFQTTKIEPGKYYPYTIELDPYDYIFNTGSRIGLMVFGTDPDYGQLYDECCIPEFDIKIGPESYAMLPLILAEPDRPVTLEVESKPAAPGGVAEVAYSIKDNDFGFSVLDLELPFDSSIYTPMKVELASLASGASLTYTIAGDVLRIAIAAENNLAGDGQIFTVTYQVAKDAPYLFTTPLEVMVKDAACYTFLDKMAGLEVIVNAGALSNYSFNLYLQPEQTVLSAGDTLAVDVKLVGDLNYTQVIASIAYDTGLLQFTGYANLGGLAAEVKKDGVNKINVRSVPSLNMMLGAPCVTPARVVTLKFKVKEDLAAESIGSVSFAAIAVYPVASVAKFTTAPGLPVSITVSE